MENSLFVYVKISADNNGDDADVIEIPSEEDGTLLLSTIQAQFPSTTGLRYKNEDSWRGIRISHGILFPPPEGWSESTYYVVRPKSDNAANSSTSGTGK